MSEASLTSASQNEVRGGFEIYEFELAFTAVQGILESAERRGDPDYLKEAMCGYYLHPERPTRDQVFSVKIEAPNGSRVRVTMIIARGPQTMGALMREHSTISILSQGSIFIVACACHNMRWELSKGAFPDQARYLP